jgi:hypothetical protein
MHRSSDLTDEPSRLKQFAWEQWENQPFAVLFRYVRIEEKNQHTLIHIPCEYTSSNALDIL